jgi:hypothetical protein
MVESPTKTDFLQARQGFLVQAQRKVTVIALTVVLPGLIAIYTITAVRHPCWQTIGLVGGVLAMGAGWLNSFSRGSKGELERAVFWAAMPTVSFLVLKILLRDRSSTSTMRRCSA